MANFNKAFQKVIKAEGGYVFDKDDRGGETYLGISRKYHPNSPMWKYVDEIKKNHPKATNKELTNILKRDKRIDPIVEDVYKEKYWNKLRLDNVKSQKIAEQLFDMGVNAGISTAIRIMNNVIGNTVSANIADDNFIKSVNGYSERNKFRKI